MTKEHRADIFDETDVEPIESAPMSESLVPLQSLDGRLSINTNGINGLQTGDNERLNQLQTHLDNTRNPYIAAAAPIVNLILVVNEGAMHQNFSTLHRIAAGAIREFHSQMISRKPVSMQNVGIASYVLCSAFDEAVLTSDWGGESDWRKETLLWTFHNDGSGGENVFKYLDDLALNPEQDLDLLELLVLLLDLGFQGHYRIAPDGAYLHETIRTRLHETIRANKPRASSPIRLPEPATGSGAPRFYMGRKFLALCAAGAALILLIGYLNFYLRTQHLTEPLTNRIEQFIGDYRSSK